MLKSKFAFALENMYQPHQLVLQIRRIRLILLDPDLFQKYLGSGSYSKLEW
jgi:hypothetical protein